MVGKYLHKSTANPNVSVLDTLENQQKYEFLSEMDPIAALSSGIPDDYNNLLTESQTETELPMFGNFSS